ncbi:hypothetical protein [Clostridium nigeriense]|uniref:hypothetical protein n=1 Tax=Clostridium nigeriense TaxID=1805470 RepID=UPI0008321946|nr:hypothetical protein [Clostridium nigeriense]
MSKEYCIYKGKKFLMNIYNNKVELTSSKKEDMNNGFKEYVDVLGNKHSDILVKEVSVDDLEFAYELNYKVIYNNIEFEPWCIGKHILNNEKISLFTSNSDLASLYGFNKEEQFVFKKELKLNDIEALIEIKIPILKFNHMKEERTRIEQKYIKKYLEDIIL